MFYLEFTKLPPISTKQVGFRVAAIHEKAENEDPQRKYRAVNFIANAALLLLFIPIKLQKYKQCPVWCVLSSFGLLGYFFITRRQ